MQRCIWWRTRGLARSLECNQGDSGAVLGTKAQCTEVYKVKMQWSAVEYSAVQRSGVQWSTVYCSALQCSAVQCSAAVQFSAQKCRDRAHGCQTGQG